VLNAIASTVTALSLDAGRDFELVLVSFDPRETPAQATAKKAEYLARYRSRPGGENGWHFLTGDEPQIRRVTQAAGYRYTWDDQTQQFAHPTGIIVTTPDGRNARYLFGIEYGPRDVKFALVEASEGRVGSVVDSLLLYCYHYDPMTGRYGIYIMRALRIAGVTTVLFIGTFIVVMVRRERSQQTPAH
jgi:protein SCO1/2